MKTQKFPIIGFISVWPTRRIVKVKIEPDKDHKRYVNRWSYPYKISSLEKGVKIGNAFDDHFGDNPHEAKTSESFNIADPSLIKLYPSQKSAEKGELEKLHEQYTEEKRVLRIQQERVKQANKQIAEYKAFKQIQTIFLNL